jgi:hypothetical protein
LGVSGGGVLWTLPMPCWSLFLLFLELSTTQTDARGREGCCTYSLPVMYRLDQTWWTRSTRKCGVQWTQPPYDPATSTNGKEPRQTPNKNRTGQRQSTDRLIIKW